MSPNIQAGTKTHIDDRSTRVQAKARGQFVRATSKKRRTNSHKWLFPAHYENTTKSEVNVIRAAWWKWVVMMSTLRLIKAPRWITWSRNVTSNRNREQSRYCIKSQQVKAKANTNGAKEAKRGSFLRAQVTHFISFCSICSDRYCLQKRSEDEQNQAIRKFIQLSIS